MRRMIGRLAVLFILGLCFESLFASTPAEDPLPARYAKWLNEDVTYIISDVERDVFLRCKTDGERDLFIESFWKARDPNPATPANEFRDEHYRRLKFVNLNYSSGETPGWKTELGRLYIVAGESWPRARAGAEPSVRLRFFIGIKEGDAPTPPPVTSSFLTSTISASVEAEADIEKARGRLASVFNLRAVKLLTEAELPWPGQGQGREILDAFDLDGNPYLLKLAPLGEGRSRHFRISIAQNRPLDAERKTVLETDFVLPENKTAVFGFQNAAGRPYFLSVGILAFPASEAPPQLDPAAARESRGFKDDPEEFERGAVRCSALVPLPKLVRSIDAVYPEIAKQAKVEGTVMLDIRTDRTGRVRNIRIKRSVPLLDRAAVEAVRQWTFEPVVVNGTAVEAILTAGIAFRLQYGGPGTAVFQFPGDKIVTGAVKIEGETAPPKLLESVPPVYPEIARQAKVEGLVILGVRADEKGRVEAVSVLRSVPLLDQAAVDAVRQWVYEPLLVEGKPRKAAFTVSVRVGPEASGSVATRVLQYEPQTDMLFDPMFKSLEALGYRIGLFQRGANRSRVPNYPYIMARRGLADKDMTLNVLVRFVRKTPVTRVEIEVKGAGPAEMGSGLAERALDEVVGEFEKALKIR